MLQFMAIGPELTKNKRNLTIFRSHHNMIQNKHSQFQLSVQSSDWKMEICKFFIRKLLSQY